jgi:hypothetical protein
MFWTGAPLAPKHKLHNEEELLGMRFCRITRDFFFRAGRDASGRLKYKVAEGTQPAFLSRGEPPSPE